MRRAPIVITATVIGAAGVLLFKPLTTVPGITAAASTGDTGAATSSASTGSATPSAAASASPSSSPKRSAKKSTASTVKDGTYTGATETTRFGTTQVQVTISGGKITAVKALELNQNDPRSVQISENAAPQLRSEVLSKQTAAVDTISGATYTSAAYEASVQSALDKAGYVAPDKSKASTDVSNVQG